MPVINIDLGQGQTNEMQKRQLISRLSSDAAEIIGMPVEKFITFINELPLENIGLGPSTVKDLKAGR
jgi:4-oxalocrotonate tautomerase family enzyme